MKRNELRNIDGSFRASEVEHLRRRSMVPIVCGIYKIINPVGEIYIGGSRTIYRRWLRHREARKKIKIHESIKRYGWRCHVFEVIHKLPLDITSETLIEYEQLYIDFYRSCKMPMLNVKDAGSASKFPQESKIKMSNSQRKKYSLMYNGELVEFVGLKEFCRKHDLSQKTLSDLINSNGHYRTKNYYKGYSRV